MGRAIKLVLYYFAYQLAFTFLVGLPAGIIKVMNEISENDNLAYAVGKNTASMTGLVMVLAGIAMIWHLIYFKYVQFNKTSWTEVPAKTIFEYSLHYSSHVHLQCSQRIHRTAQPSGRHIHRNEPQCIRHHRHCRHGTSGRRVAVPWSH